MVPDLERRGLVLSRVRWASGPLSLGRLQGNHFDLVVRDLTPHPCHGSQKDLTALVQEAVDNVKVTHSHPPGWFSTGPP